MSDELKIPRPDTAELTEYEQQVVLNTFVNALAMTHGLPPGASRALRRMLTTELLEEFDRWNDATPRPPEDTCNGCRFLLFMAERSGIRVNGLPTVVLVEPRKSDDFDA